MVRIFADTSYWYALLNSRDALHQAALSYSEKTTQSEIVTSDLVLIELLNAFSDGGPLLRHAGFRLATQLLSETGSVIFIGDSPKFDEVLVRYLAVSDKGWSFTDCASFLIMESLGIRSALTHDRHFEQAGFQALLR